MERCGNGLKELAQEYRSSAARLALWLEEHGPDLPTAERRRVRSMLDETRAVQRALDGYYDLPRPEGLCAVGWKAGRENDS